MYPINWTQPALNTLVLLRDHGIQDLPRMSLSFLKSLVDRTTTLELTPERGRMIFEIDNRRDIRELLFNDFRIIYRLHKHQIDTLTVIRGRKHLIGLGSKRVPIKPTLFNE